MKRLLLWIVAGVILAVGWRLYRSYSSRSRLNVEPNAAEEIEKAKRR